MKTNVAPETEKNREGEGSDGGRASAEGRHGRNVGQQVGNRGTGRRGQADGLSGQDATIKTQGAGGRLHSGNRGHDNANGGRRGDGGAAVGGGRSVVSTDSIGVGQGGKKSVESPIAESPRDSTDSGGRAAVVSLDDERKKRARVSTVSKPRRGRRDVMPAAKPRAIAGHEWRRQGTGWTLLRSWYDRTDSGGRVKRREYVQHYSATALRRAESLRGAL